MNDLKYYGVKGQNEKGEIGKEDTQVSERREGDRQFIT